MKLLQILEATTKQNPVWVVKFAYDISKSDTEAHDPNPEIVSFGVWPSHNRDQYYNKPHRQYNDLLCGVNLHHLSQSLTANRQAGETALPEIGDRKLVFDAAMAAVNATAPMKAFYDPSNTNVRVQKFRSLVGNDLFDQIYRTYKVEYVGTGWDDQQDIVGSIDEVEGEAKSPEQIWYREDKDEQEIKKADEIAHDYAKLSTDAAKAVAAQASGRTQEPDIPPQYVYFTASGDLNPTVANKLWDDIKTGLVEYSRLHNELPSKAFMELLISGMQGDGLFFDIAQNYNFLGLDDISKVMEIFQNFFDMAAELDTYWTLEHE